MDAGIGIAVVAGTVGIIGFCTVAFNLGGSYERHKRLREEERRERLADEHRERQRLHTIETRIATLEKAGGM